MMMRQVAKELADLEVLQSSLCDTFSVFEIKKAICKTKKNKKMLFFVILFP